MGLSSSEDRHDCSLSGFDMIPEYDGRSASYADAL